MMQRLMRAVGLFVVRYPIWIACASLALTIFFWANIHRLRTGTELTDLFGNSDPQWRTITAIGKQLGFQNQLYIVIEPAPGIEADNEAIEAAADKLTEAMNASGYFREARSGLSEKELLNLVKLYSWNFPFFATPAQQQPLAERLDPKRIHRNVREAAAELINPFSTLSTDYFVADPLGVMRTASSSAQGFAQFSSFDFNWGSGNRFFSRDHSALLVIAEPRQPAVDYQYAGQILDWTRAQLTAICSDGKLRATPAGAYVFAEQDHKFVESNIRRVSTVSIVCSLVLCLLVYPNLQLLFLSLLPTGLGILWTTGIASFYPGEVNLISLSFIAILAGLGDDQVVHFFNRSPQEWTREGGFNAAMVRTYETTGLSIVVCILTAASATAALATSSFKALAEFGFILTVGMFMMGIHTLFTVPALMQLWNRFIRPFAPTGIIFRFLPGLARRSLDRVGRHPRPIVFGALGLFLISAALLPAIRMTGTFSAMGSTDSPAMAAQNLLAARFGIESSPSLLLISGSEQQVLRRGEELTGALEEYQRNGALASVFSPTQLLPSLATQRQHAAALSAINLKASAQALEDALRENGLNPAPFQPYIERLRQLSEGAQPLTFESAVHYFPAGLLENSLRRTESGNYVAAIALYPSAGAPGGVPAAQLNEWRRRFGPFVEFSFDKINRDVQTQVLHDSRQALCLTALAIFLIVYLVFRDLRTTLLVLMPIVFAIVVTFGLLRLVGHSFSFMSVTAIPLIIGIGIDNGIHLVRRYRERVPNSILDVAKASGAALIQSNLTTMVGFGALLFSTFPPLAELGLVTTVGVALTLAGSLWIIPALLLSIKSGQLPPDGLQEA